MTSVFKITTQEELKKHFEQFTDLLSQAFYNDPYYVYIMPDDKKRKHQIRWWMGILLKYTLKRGEIFVTSDYNGLAMWLGPNRPKLDNIKLALLGLILYPFKVGVRNFFNMLQVSTEWENEHNKQAKRHCYLMIIGVNPSVQRMGIGSKLMQEVLPMADKDKFDCYLETVTEDNVKFYQSHKFEIIYSKEFGSNSRYWLMKRNPQ